MKKASRLSAKDIFKKCNLGFLKIKNSKQLTPCREIVGQKRAIDSIILGLNINKMGYNIYLSGQPGVGKKTVIKSLLSEIAKNKEVPNDWCYVYNFQNPKEPKAITLIPGRGKTFSKDMDQFIEVLETSIPKTFESKDFDDEKVRLADYFNKKKEELFNKLRNFAKKNDIQIQFAPTGIVTLPMLKGKPVSHEQFESLDEKTRNSLKAKKDKVDNEVAAILKQTRMIDKEYVEKVSELENKVALFAVNDLMENLMEKYKDIPEIKEYLEHVENDIVSNIEKFLPKKQQATFLGAPGGAQGVQSKNPLNEYKVNVIIDNSQTKGAPVVFEPQPNYINLFGSIEREVRMGAMVTDFTLIRDGSIFKANGGYLVVEVLDLFKFPFVWDTLKKIVENGELRVEDAYQNYGYSNIVGMRPEPIKIDIKVIMTGPPHVFQMLQNYDIDFKRLFKIKADFDSVIKKSEKTLHEYSCALKSICDNEDLMDFERSALEATIEHSTRLAGNQEKLSTQFGIIIKVMVESNYWARQDGSKMVRRTHVEKAINEKKFRSNLYEEKTKELITDGTFMVDTEGAVIGQINGLSVYNMGDYSFGRPNRITCETYMGVEGVVNIERKAKLSGNIHDKGVLILNGYLGTKFAQEKPLSLSASIGFEQSYSMIDGDSASAAELITVMSSLAEVPIKQNFAITGSVNQKGEIQPIGGVNQKVEGFFDICKAKGLTGDQGVLIPHQNVKNLMLNGEVLEAVKKKKFNLYAIKTIDEGVEILTGMESGGKLKDDKFKENTFNYLVNKKLRELAFGNRKFGRKMTDDDSATQVR